MDAATERLITVVVDAIECGSDVITAEVRRTVCAEVTSPPSLDQVEHALELLQAPGLRYRPGDIGWVMSSG
ncbi:hypothetical protein [Nocardia vinacea]|uniref:hypothetical protein n=1 Tax=Nocardia vinacea TaxID=96468 RepID=UPI00030D7ECE|nr:hypothetical protein [Nocardia vinacea]